MNLRLRRFHLAAIAVTLLLLVAAMPRPSNEPSGTAAGVAPLAPTAVHAGSGTTGRLDPPRPAAPEPNADATPTWTDLSATAGAPPPRISGGLVYDGEDGYTLLFGGEYLNTTTFHTQYYNDTWEFSGGKWTNITPARSPSPRFGFGLVYDAFDADVILFGGRNAAGYALNDTWKFSGGHWSNYTSSPAPSPRFWPSMTYDSTSSDIVLFGGVSATSSDLNDTWTFSAGAWSPDSPTSHPSSRHGGAFTDDPQQSGSLLFGGLGASYYNDTWLWTGSNWVDETGSLGSSFGPDARVGAGGAYDAALGETVVYGGYPANTYPDGTWLYAKLNWTLYNNLPNTPPSTTIWEQLTYDAADSWVVYLVPNTNETFVFNTTIGTGPPGLQVTASATPLTGYVPLTVTLSAAISGGTPPYNATWSTGTGTSLYRPNTSATYATPGTYNLALTVRDTASGLFVDNWTVRAEARPLSANISASPPSAAVGQSVDFLSNHSGGWGPFTFRWAFGDGSTAATQNATHAYTAANTYDGSFTVTATIGGSTTLTFTEIVTAAGPGPLTLAASLTPTSGTVPLTVSGTSLPSGGVPPYTYRWTWGDGSPTSTTENATHAYPTAGDYAATLNVSDASGSSVQKVWPVTVAAPLAVTISATPTAAAAGATVTFGSDPSGGTQPYTYAWTLGDGASATSRNTTHAYPTAGVYTVNLTLTDFDGHTARASVTVTVSGGASATTGSSQSGGLAGWDWIILGLVVVLVAALVFVVAWRRRRRSSPPR